MGHPNLSAGSPPPPGTRYTCPMHPEIIRDAPGTCPKCGMALEPMLPSVEDEPSPELADFTRRFWFTLPGYQAGRGGIAKAGTQTA